MQFFYMRSCDSMCTLPTCACTSRVAAQGPSVLCVLQNMVSCYYAVLLQLCHCHQAGCRSESQSYIEHHAQSMHGSSTALILVASG